MQLKDTVEMMNSEDFKKCEICGEYFLIEEISEDGLCISCYEALYEFLINEL